MGLLKKESHEGAAFAYFHECDNIDLRIRGKLDLKRTEV